MTDTYIYTYIYVSDRRCGVLGSLIIVAIGGFNGRALDLLSVGG